MEAFAKAVPDGDPVMAISPWQCLMETLAEAVPDGDETSVWQCQTETTLWQWQVECFA
jgi:hypothetical protein